MIKSVNEWVTRSVSECVSAWVWLWVRECDCEWVSESDSDSLNQWSTTDTHSQCNSECHSHCHSVTVESVTVRVTNSNSLTQWVELCNGRLQSKPQKTMWYNVLGVSWTTQAGPTFRSGILKCRLAVLRQAILLSAGARCANRLAWLSVTTHYSKRKTQRMCY